MTQSYSDATWAIAIIKSLAGLDERDIRAYINQGNPAKTARFILENYVFYAIEKVGATALYRCMDEIDSKS